MKSIERTVDYVAIILLVCVGFVWGHASVLATMVSSWTP